MLKVLRQLARGQTYEDYEIALIADMAYPLVELGLAAWKEERDAETGVAELERMYALKDPRS